MPIDVWPWLLIGVCAVLSLAVVLSTRSALRNTPTGKVQPSPEPSWVYIEILPDEPDDLACDLATFDQTIDAELAALLTTQDGAS
jgi:hypothetical protein